MNHRRCIRTPDSSHRLSWALVAAVLASGCEGAVVSTADGGRADAAILADDGAITIDGGPRPDTGPAATDDAGTTAETELTSLPPDTGGEHTPHPLGTTTAELGYYNYLPGGYEDTTASYPLIVFLHGRGERGDGDSQLGRVLNQGIPRLIERGTFSPTHPVIVASPQFPNPDGVGNDNNWGEGDPSRVRGFIEHMIATYRINTHRIYLTGLSHGGNGVYDYLVLQDDETSYLAAAAPIAAWGPNRGFEHSAHTPIWVFVGSADGSNFRTSTGFVDGYNTQDPAPTHEARYSVYDGAGHDVWTRTYDLSGMGTADPDYDPYDVSIYDWMFSHRRD